jgi:SAM-dependent methyltransferase
MTSDVVVDDFDPAWLALREPADGDARASSLAERLANWFTASGTGELVVHDLGSGTGSLARWLAPRLPGRQVWVLHDRDPRLLELARERTAGLAAADGTPVTVRTAVGDLTTLGPADLAGAGLITASALLDLLTPASLDALVQTCVAVGCPVLWTLSVTGAVTLDPADPLDDPLTAAFDAHQRRGGLLGPDAPDAAAATLGRHGMAVRMADSPWRLAYDRNELLAEWLRGRVDAAVEQDPELAAQARTWLRDRLTAVAAGRLTATVGHRDLLAAPTASIPGKTLLIEAPADPSATGDVSSGSARPGGAGHAGAPPVEVAR